MDKVKKYAPWVLIILILMSMWHGWQNRYEYAKHFITPAPPKVIMKIKTIQAECVPVVYYKKADAIKKDIVPEHIKHDPDKQVTAAIEVPPHIADTLITSTFNMRTGINALSYRQKQPPFFAFLNEKEIGVRYGVNTGADGTGFDVYGSWSIFRIGAVHAALYAEATNAGEAKAMLQGGARF